MGSGVGAPNRAPFGGMGVKPPPPELNTLAYMRVNFACIFAHKRYAYMLQSQSACYIYRRWWGCIILVVSPVSALE